MQAPVVVADDDHWSGFRPDQSALWSRTLLARRRRPSRTRRPRATPAAPCGARRSGCLHPSDPAGRGKARHVLAGLLLDGRRTPTASSRTSGWGRASDPAHPGDPFLRVDRAVRARPADVRRGQGVGAVPRQVVRFLNDPANRVAHPWRHRGRQHQLRRDLLHRRTTSSPPSAPFRSSTLRTHGNPPGRHPRPRGLGQFWQRSTDPGVAARYVEGSWTTTPSTRC